jgi:integrase/recombinase XerD
MGQEDRTKGRTVMLKGLMAGKSKSGKLHWYVRRKGLPLVKLPDLPHDDPAFLAAYAAAWVIAAPERPLQSLEAGIALHIRKALSSSRYCALSPAYRSALRRHCDEIVRDYGALPLDGLRDRHIAADVTGSDAPALRLKTWRFVCKGMLPDPSRGVTVDAPKVIGHEPWTADDVAAFRARWPIGTTPRACMELMLWTACRISDAVRIGRGNVGADGVLSFRQQKTKGMTFVPWTCALPAYADDMQADRDMMHEAIGANGHMTFLATAHGAGRSAKALGTLIQFSCQKAGIDKSAHGLRKARAVALAEAGATTHQIAAWTGHATLKEVEHYTKESDRRRAVMGNANPLRRVNANTAKRDE